MQPIQSNQQIKPPLPKIAHQQSHPIIPRYASQKKQINLSSSLQGFDSNISLQSSGSRLSLERMSSNISMQSMDSSESMISRQPSQTLLPTQTFSVIYNRIIFMVDPFLLMNASSKFNELIQPFMINNQVNPDAQLEILGSKFTNRNMNNFLNLCQNLPSDVENSEMKEICEIAKMFQAEKIYDTGITFIRQYMDPNFTVPDDKYDESDGKIHMFIECENHIIHHADLNDLDFDDFDDENEEKNENSNKDENESTKENKIKIKKEDKNEVKSEVKDEVKSEVKDEVKSEVKNEVKSEDKQINANENVKNNNNNKLNDNEAKDTSKKAKSIIYHVFVETHSMKCNVYRFISNKKVLYSAKQKDNNIYIGNGRSIHINKDTSNHVGHIHQDDNKTNFVLADEDKFEIKYVDSGRPKHYSLSVTFPYKDKQLTWTPKTPKYDSAKNKYYLNFHGEYHRNPIKSGKNIVLANSNGHTVFIARKMADNVFELESLPSVKPLIIFTIGLSDIVGQFNDQFGGI